MAKSAEVKLAVFGRAGVGKSGKIFVVVAVVCVYVCVFVTVLYYSLSKRMVGISPILRSCSFQ